VTYSLGLFVLNDRLEVIIWRERKVKLESVIAETSFESKVDTYVVRYKKTAIVVFFFFFFFFFFTNLY
jgi:hypothetical protein